MRSPYHLRIVEVRNLTSEPRTLAIEPAPDQHLGAATTFRGALAPGEVKMLYLYHGFEYIFRILDAPGHREIVRNVLEVKRDVGLAFAGESLVSEARLVAELGEPSFADSLQQQDPFGLRSGRPIIPDSTRGEVDPYGVGEAGRRGGAEPPQ